MNGDDEYKVENVLGHFHTADGFWFLVKWTGFVTPTWQHESTMDAARRVTEYFKSVCESDA